MAAEVLGAMYLATMPQYRQACISCLDEQMGPTVRYYVGEANMDPSVRTNIVSNNVVYVRDYRLLGGRLMVMFGKWVEAATLRTLILDLNPRNLTVWIILFGRILLRRRTIFWGHLHPREGRLSRTARLRRAVRKLGDGMICYSYEQQKEALEELPRQPVWVAPNALYLEGDIKAGPGVHRDSIVYVGRLAPAKKVELALHAFSQVLAAHPGLRFVIVGDGSERSRLEAAVRKLGLSGSVEFVGWIADVGELSAIYDRAIVSVCPGYAGLSLTQSLGFGVPHIVSRDEPHSPEIELESTGGVIYFETDDVAALARTIEEVVLTPPERETREKFSAHVRATYSAEKMADGLREALSSL
ncbi:glycosyltransferase family 4 protein [Actinomycetospora termitidis]|uniref:Glycosyltransferase family 4 protein n=1 Tax=Actinomycetospora termitidis TaxID=3053470 RepID=A0ABT7ME85_9PSEU|nr:glycosyltransferase family 4 protein [Actinomycetospora sp. Odt1-22]MDL5158977.1 glycosyltransferase family 4 protein [Actinomycetospora sp. Odt1-22]